MEWAAFSPPPKRSTVGRNLVSIRFTEPQAQRTETVSVEEVEPHVDDKTAVFAHPKETSTMNRLACAVFSLVGVFAASTALAADPLVVKLWPGKTPGDVGIEGREYSYIYQSQLLKGPTKLITNVTKPTLTIYSPDKDTNTGAAMLICPGGGYHNLFWQLEGEEVAAWLNSIGMTGIILKYRVPRRPGDIRGEPPLGPLLDAQRAVSLVRSRAAEWGIDPGQIGIVGFSAGGHLAMATAASFERRTYQPIDAIDQVSCRPDFAVLCYSGYFKAKDKDAIIPSITIPAGTPPILLAHATDDDAVAGGADVENSAFMYIALKRAGIPVEMHIYATGGHDFGVRQNDKLPSSWTHLCVKWLQSQGFAKPNSSNSSRVDSPTR